MYEKLYRELLFLIKLKKDLRRGLFAHAVRSDNPTI